MTALAVVLRLTFRELWARKTVLGVVVVATLVLGMVALLQLLLDPANVVAQVAEDGAEVRQLSGDEALRFVSSVIDTMVAGAAYWVGIVLALFTAAPLFTAFVERGRIDLLLAKPVGRVSVLAGHILAVWAVVAVLAAYLLGGVWVINSVATGEWNVGFLGAIPLVVAMFAVMYAPALLAGMWTGSTAVSLIVAYGLIFLSVLTVGGEALLRVVRDGFPLVGAGLTAAYYVLPNFAEMTWVVADLARPDLPGFLPDDSAGPMAWVPFLSSLAFGAVVYAATVREFVRRDF